MDNVASISPIPATEAKKGAKRNCHSVSLQIRELIIAAGERE